MPWYRCLEIVITIEMLQFMITYESILLGSVSERNDYMIKV